MELRLNGGDLCREGNQNALDLLRFLCAVLQDASVCLHDGLRLHKDCCARGGDIVDDAVHFAAVFTFDRDDIPAVSHGNDALLQIFGGVHVADHSFQTVADAVFSGVDLLAQLIQCARSRVSHGIRCQNGAGDLLLQAGLRGQRVEQVVCRQRFVIRGTVPAAQILEVAECPCYHQKLSHREDTALDSAGHQLADTLHTAEPGRTVFDEQAVDGVRLFQRIADLVRVALGLQRQHLRFGLPADTALGCTGNDLIKLKCF